jgi:hypothetical protein
MPWCRGVEGSCRSTAKDDHTLPRIWLRPKGTSASTSLASATLWFLTLESPGRSPRGKRLGFTRFPVRAVVRGLSAAENPQSAHAAGQLASFAGSDASIEAIFRKATPPDARFNTAPGARSWEPTIVLGRGYKIGRKEAISSKDQIVLDADVLLALSFPILDHNHEFYDIQLQIHAQCVIEGGKIVV